MDLNVNYSQPKRLRHWSLRIYQDEKVSTQYDGNYLSTSDVQQQWYHHNIQKHNLQCQLRKNK